MKAVHCIALSVTLLAGSFVLSAQNKFDFAVIGDAPYGPAGGTPKVQQYPALPYERLIAEINTARVGDRKSSFVIHVGDIKAGDTLCENNVYTQNLTYFNTFQIPAIFVPGDNEWTDCHRGTNGSFDPLERLSFLRQTFYPNNQTLGQTKLTVTRQANYPENSRWKYGPVLFVTLNMPGSNNGLQNASSGGGVPNPHLAAMDAEYTARNAANVAWLNQAFDQAAADTSIKGVLIAIQANPFERFLEAGQTYTISGYSEFMSTLRTRTVQFDKPVVLAHGDTHYFRIDRPMTGIYPACAGGVESPCTAVPVPASPTDRIDNFLRLEVFAQNDVHWVRILVDSSNPDIFSFSPQRVEGN
jgi:hypothetical protein